MVTTLRSPAQGYHFPTPIGRCGLTWGELGVQYLELPRPTPAALRRALQDHGVATVEDAADGPAEVAEIATAIAAMIAGRDDDLTWVPLDQTGITPFARSVYDATRTIGPGHTATYGKIAAMAGTGAARAVGRAMGANSHPIVVPCHRVTAAGGRIGGYSAEGGIATKVRLLLAEARGDGNTDPLPYDVDEACAWLSAADELMAETIRRVGPCTLRLRPLGTTVAALCEAIVSQQLSGRAAATIHARLCTAFPDPLAGPTARGLAAMTETELRAVGLSRAKTLAVHDLATRALAGQIPDLDELALLADDDVVDALTSVRGIGRWTVEMLLIFRLGRPDVLPVDDLGVRKGFARMAGRASVTPAELADHGQRWHPYASVASWYLWRATELP